MPCFRRNGEDNRRILKSLRDCINERDKNISRALYLHDYTPQGTDQDTRERDDTQCRQLPLASAILGKECREAALLVLDGGEAENLRRAEQDASLWKRCLRRNRNSRILRIIKKCNEYFKKPELVQRDGNSDGRDVVRQVFANPGQQRLQFHKEIRVMNLEDTEAYKRCVRDCK